MAKVLDKKKDGSTRKLCGYLVCILARLETWGLLVETDCFPRGKELQKALLHEGGRRNLCTSECLRR